MKFDENQEQNFSEFPFNYEFVRIAFVNKIEHELYVNSLKKGDWHNWQPNPFLLASEITWHFAKLLQAIENGDPVKVSEYAADVAAYCMKADEVYGTA